MRFPSRSKAGQKCQPCRSRPSGRPRRLFAMADSGMVGQAVGLHESVDEFSCPSAQHVDDHHVAVAVKALIRRSDNAVVVGCFDPAFVGRKRLVEVGSSSLCLPPSASLHRRSHRSNSRFPVKGSLSVTILTFVRPSMETICARYSSLSGKTCRGWQKITELTDRYPRRS